MLNYQKVPVDASKKLTAVELMLLMLKCWSEELLVSLRSSAQVAMEDTKVFETTKEIHREVASITKIIQSHFYLYINWLTQSSIIISATCFTLPSTKAHPKQASRAWHAPQRDGFETPHWCCNFRYDSEVVFSILGSIDLGIWPYQCKQQLWKKMPLTRPTLHPKQ